MTIDEAISKIKDIPLYRLEQGYDVHSEVCEALIMSAEALEKQIPKKPIDDIEYPICPSCGKPFYRGCNDRYCVDCGQKLDWSVEE